jgi:predicted acetyltransferase/predicted lactoylglutathione lyase
MGAVVDDKISGQPPMLLRPLAVPDEKQARHAHRELAQDAFDFLLDLKRGEPWPAYLARLEGLRLGVDPPKGWVPATFLVAEVDGQIVGRVSIRHQLNPYLADVAGHIGIGVRPDFRRRGYATAILRQSLAVAASTGLTRLLVTCDANNVGSINVIENCGGVLEDVSPARRDAHKCRFWVEAGSPAARLKPPRRRTAMAHRLPLVGSEATPQKSVTAEADQPNSAAAMQPTAQRHCSPNDSAMEQRVSLISLGVADLKRSRAFYERLGWQGQEVGETVFFQVSGIALVLWSRDKLALDCGLHDEQAGGFSGVVLAHNVRSEAEVEDVITSAERAGATVTRHPARTSDGGYAGFFIDPDGHAWEVAHKPGSPLAEDGSMTVPDFSSP